MVPYGLAHVALSFLPAAKLASQRTVGGCSGLIMTFAGDHWSNLIPETRDSSFKSCFCKLEDCLLIKFHGRGEVTKKKKKRERK